MWSVSFFNTLTSQIQIVYLKIKVNILNGSANFGGDIQVIEIARSLILASNKAGAVIKQSKSNNIQSK